MPIDTRHPKEIRADIRSGKLTGVTAGLAQGRAFGARVVGYHFASRVPESLARNRGREGRARVPDVAIFATAKRFQAPSHTEGFDELWRVGIAGDMRFEVSAIPRDEPPASATTATAEVS